MPLLWIGFYGKQTLRWCLARRMLIKECSWYQHLWKGGEGAEEEAKLWSWPSVSPTVSSGAKMACQSCPPLGWKSQSLFKLTLGEARSAEATPEGIGSISSSWSCTPSLKGDMGIPWSPSQKVLSSTSACKLSPTFYTYRFPWPCSIFP